MSGEDMPLQFLQRTLDLMVLRTLATIGSGPIGTTRMDQVHLGKNGEQSGSKVLHHHQTGTEDSARGNAALAANGQRYG
jgi:hypothetical protein